MGITVTLTPTANGTYQENNVSSGTHWEAVVSVGGEYLYSDYRVRQTDTFVLSPAVIGNAIISKVTLTGQFYSPSGVAGEAQLAVYFDGVLYTYTKENVDGGQTDILTEEFTNAPDGTPWLRSDLDSIEWGAKIYAYNAGGGRADYIKIDVEYIPVLAGGAQIIGLGL